jgi:NADPH-dependent 2,4-dienoyl-CoA reductase/sulfur reductase-like enzyme/nitrite reductase/ring-hydroxylating ferredoxin subunit
MGATQDQPSGPDLAAGVAASAVPDGGSLLGHAAGEAVLLARQGDELFAVGATCTHYSGPLAEGLVVGDEVRCPLHHACFSLRTGEALRAPALNPIPCFEVVRDGDLVRVGARRPAPVPPTRSGGPERVVIVGGGAAGHAAAEMLRRLGHTGPVTLVSADEAPPVDRPNLSKDYLAGTAPEEWIPLRPPEFYAEQGIELLLGARAERVDAAARAVHLADGRALDYDTLLLATGATPIRLALPGADLPHVHVLRTLADSRAIIAALPAARRVVVLGASFIGLEAAAALRTRGLEVDVVAPEAVPLERVMGRAVGSFVRKLHEDKGVRFHLGRRPASISAEDVTLDDGAVLAADLVVMGVGVRPALELAQSAGCATDPRSGVLVDAQLATSVPGIWAAGDIAGWPDASGERLRVEHWVVAQRQGQTAARNMLGAGVPFQAAPFFWSVHYDVTIDYVGHADPARCQIVVEGDLGARDAKVTYSDGRVRAVATVARDRDSLRAELELESGR